MKQHEIKIKFKSESGSKYCHFKPEKNKITLQAFDNWISLKDSSISVQIIQQFCEISQMQIFTEYMI